MTQSFKGYAHLSPGLVCIWDSNLVITDDVIEIADEISR